MTVIKRREGWPTPTAKDANGPWHTTHSPSLNVVVTTFPTPCAWDHHAGGPGANRANGHMLQLATLVQKLIPMPNSLGAKYPTPQTDHTGGGVNARKKLQALEREGELTDKERRGIEMKTHGLQLNPDWEEWLMSWPVGWTDIETPNIRLVWLDPSIDPADYGEIPRITNRRDNRPARVKEIGNGQFPLTAAAAFHWGLCVLQLVNKGEK